MLPISQTIISHNLPIYYCRDGIHAVFDEFRLDNRLDKAQDFEFIKFQDLTLIAVEGKNIKFNNTHIIKTPSSPSARFHADFIHKLKILEAEDRIDKIKAYLSGSYDLEAIKKIETSSSKSLAMIKILGSNLFVLVFFILPASLFSNLCKYIHLNALVICIFLTYLLLLLVALLTLKKLYPSEKDYRSYTLQSIIFSPINAIHVLSYLTKDLYVRFNYLALAAYYMPRNSFKELARKEIFQIDYFEHQIGRQDWQEFWRLKKQLLRCLLDQCEVSLQEVSKPPEKQDQTAIYYCPFCMTEYRQKRHNCIDCETALKEFDSD